MSIEEELGKMIQKAAIDGTLNEKAVEHYNAIIAENKALHTALDEKREDYRQADQERMNLRSALTAVQESVDGFEQREKELAEKESAAEVLAMTVKYEQKRVEDHKEMVGLIFRNTLLKRQAMTPGHHGHVDQYGTTIGAEYATKHDLEEKEE